MLTVLLCALLGCVQPAVLRPPMVHFDAMHVFALILEPDGRSARDHHYYCIVVDRREIHCTTAGDRFTASDLDVVYFNK